MLQSSNNWKEEKHWNYVTEEINERRLNMGNGCYHLLQNVPISYIQMWTLRQELPILWSEPSASPLKYTELYVVLYGCEVWSLIHRGENIDWDVWEQGTKENIWT